MASRVSVSMVLTKTGSVRRDVERKTGLEPATLTLAR
jgi:hypothetical protein